jgi:DNA-binding transcriptional MocR family regulator
MGVNFPPISAADIAADLALVLHRREVEPGGRLPSQARIKNAYGVSEATAAAALDRLVAVGLATRHVGRGTFASADVASSPLLALLAAAAVCAEATTDPTRESGLGLGLDADVLAWMSAALIAETRRAIAGGDLPDARDRRTRAARAILAAGPSAVLPESAYTLDAAARAQLLGPHPAATRQPKENP